MSVLERLENAAKAVMLEDQRRVLKESDSTVKALKNRYLGETYNDSDPDDMQVGDNHITIKNPPQQSSGMSPLMKGLLAAALAVGSGGALGTGLAIPQIIKALQPQQQAEQPAGFQDTDTDTIMELSFGD